MSAAIRGSIRGLAMVRHERVFRHGRNATHAPTPVDLPVHTAYAGATGSSPACCCEAIVS